MARQHHPDFNDAVAVKRQLADLDANITDGQLDKHLKKYGGRDAEPKLTLGTALLLRPDIAAALNHQLGTLAPFVFKGRVRSVAKQLLNDTEGLLNTWAEFGLAMRLIEDGWSVEIGTEFHGKKDVDVRAEKDGVVRHIDVINLAPEPFVESPSGFYPMPGSTPLEPKLL